MSRISFLLLLFLCTACNQSTRDCDDYRTGTFKFTYTLDGKEQTTKFKRTENLNIDYLKTGNDTASIRWINNCEFVQKDLSPKSNQEEQAVHFKILSTTSDSYTFEYSLAIKPTNKPHRTERGTAYKID